MDENNSKNEKLYTEEQVIRAIMQMQPEQREFLFSTKFENIMGLANNPDYAKYVVWYYAKYAELCLNALETVKEFVELIHNQDNTTETVINNMAEYYKGLSREERLEFGKKIAKESELENSLDLFKFQFGKLLSRLHTNQ